MHGDFDGADALIDQVLFMKFSVHPMDPVYVHDCRFTLNNLSSLFSWD